MSKENGIPVLMNIVLSSLFACMAMIQPAHGSERLQVDWPAFMAQHDLVWEETPLQWNEGAFTGNGMLGIMAYASLADNRFDLHLGRRDIHEHRQGMGGQRLDLGRMALRPAGVIQSVKNLRQDLWNAELRGTIVTDLGEIDFRVVTLRNRMVHLIDTRTTEKHADGSAADFKWEFLPGNPAAPRPQTMARLRANYRVNPRPQMTEIDGVPVCLQALLSGGDYATAWLHVPLSGNHSRLFISTANETPQAGVSGPMAVREVKSAADTPVDQLLSEHRAWWHAFYPQSFVSIPHPKMESFYWIQLYKIAAGTRADGPALDLAGPWFRVNQWPMMWWNLNIQMTYWMFPTSNHMDLSETLVTYMNGLWQPLFERFGGKQDMGDLAWALLNYWLHFRYNADWDGMRTNWLPKAEQVLNSYLNDFTKTDADGTLRVLPMGSPEFLHGQYFKEVDNTHYNVALMHWLASSLDEVADKTGGHPGQSKWQDTVKRLPAFPVDEHGFMIGEDQSFDRSHRHFCHLMAFYPLFVLDPNDPKNNALLRKSIDHWFEIANPDGMRDLCNFSFAYGASTYAVLNDGERAYGLLNDYIDNRILEMNTQFKDFKTANTFQVFSDGLNPCMETPLGAANAMLELLLLSHTGQVQVFPAVPDSWDNAVFDNLRAQGAFLVSARRSDSRTQWVSVESLAGEPLTLRVRDWSGLPTVAGADASILRETQPGTYSIALAKGQRITLFPAGTRPHPVAVQPLPRAAETLNPYGVKKGQNLTTHQIHAGFDFHTNTPIPVPPLHGPRLASAQREPVVATWKTPNAAYVSLTDAANWVEGVIPHQAGDIGTIAGTDPIRVAVDHDVAWEGTLKLTRANFDFSNGGIGNGNSIKAIHMRDSAFIAQSTQRNDRSILAQGDRVTLHGNNTFSFSNNQSTHRGWNVWADIAGEGTLNIVSKRANNSATIQTILRGTVDGVNLVLSDARVQLNNTMRFRFSDGGSSINQIRGSSGRLANRLLIFGELDIDLSGFNPGNTTQRMWQLIDWSNLTDTSGWMGDGAPVRSGNLRWAPNAASTYYNGEGGRTWTLEHEGRTWTFNEAAGILSVD